MRRSSFCASLRGSWVWSMSLTPCGLNMDPVCSPPRPAAAPLRRTAAGADELQPAPTNRRRQPTKRGRPLAPSAHYFPGNRPGFPVPRACAPSLTKTMEQPMITVTARTAERGPYLRRVLYVDACTCAAMGMLLTIDTAPLSGMLGLPAALLAWAG